MDPPSPRPLLPVLSWCLLVLVRIVFHHDAGEALHFLLPIADLSLLAGGISLAWMMWKPALLLVALLIWFPGQGWLGLQRAVGTHAWLLRHESGYEQWILDHQRGAAEPGPRYEQPRGGVPRVAFPMGAGVLDNWQAIVHDPSGQVLRLEQSRGWFGGDLVVARPLWGDWYWCVFT